MNRSSLVSRWAPRKHTARSWKTKKFRRNWQDFGLTEFRLIAGFQSLQHLTKQRILPNTFRSTGSPSTMHSFQGEKIAGTKAQHKEQKREVTNNIVALHSLPVLPHTTLLHFAWHRALSMSATPHQLLVVEESEEPEEYPVPNPGSSYTSAADSMNTTRQSPTSLHVAPLRRRHRALRINATPHEQTESSEADPKTKKSY